MDVVKLVNSFDLILFCRFPDPCIELGINADLIGVCIQNTEYAKRENIQYIPAEYAENDLEQCPLVSPHHPPGELKCIKCLDVGIF